MTRERIKQAPKPLRWWQVLLMFGTGSVALWLLMRRPAPVFRVRGRPFGFRAVTLPPFGILVGEQYAADPVLMAHERRHWQQAQQIGPIPFALSYAAFTVLKGYTNNPYEVDAREAAENA